MINAFSNRLFSSKRQFDWKYEIVGIFGILSKGQQLKNSTQLKTQKLSQMSKSILQKEWSYVVWDESADIWCCFSSFYSVQVRAEISGYPELSSSLWSFMKSCNIKNVLTLGISEFLIFTQSLRFSLMMWKKTWISNCNLQTMSLHLKLGFGHFLSGSRIKVLRIAQLLAYFFLCQFFSWEKY